ncbi:hypothetical protein [Gulosibacter faecalis]|uniref:Uncharacterized protein n=1 Tax=Gulosibacter faecalis TaxID=272240 RepID=A0ABW5UY01_9MICO|nr:hypothetical protein [Gulosibacter faecalis]
MGTPITRLRALAKIERESAIERRVRAGEDPAHVVAEEPDIDELTVLMLRDEALEDEDLHAEYQLARLASRSRQSGAADLRATADEIDARLFRQIAQRHPSLSRAVWTMLGDVDHRGAPAGS